MSTASGRRLWLLPAVALVAGLLGLTLLAVAAVVGLSPDDDGTTEAQEAPPTAAPVPTVAAERLGDGGIGELPDPAWVEEVAATTGIPPRALTAYAGASIAVTRTHPQCGLGWNTLAAIGAVESEHGSINGGALDDQGRVDPQIVGVPLDGDGVMEIRDTDGGVLDGDPVWDRAVGPMQFIPSTWTAFAVDGDGDGTPDVHQLDDAALTAAVYLCETGGDLTSPEAWIAAVNAYNPSVEYNHRVADTASSYAGEVPGGA